MIRLDDDNNDGDLYSSSCTLNKNNNNVVSHHQPVVDVSGVIHRTHRTLIPGGAAAAAAAAAAKVSSSTATPTGNGGDEGCGGRNDKGGGGGNSDGIDDEEDLMEFLNNEYGSAIDLHPRISVGGTISGGGIGTENGDIGMGNKKSSSSTADDHLSSRRGVGAGANENINNNNDDTINPTTKRGYHHHLYPRNNNNNSNGMSASEEDDEDDNDDEEEEEDSSEISASDEDDASWISWFCNLRGNEYFVEVDEDYIQDDFNLTGLNGIVPYYDYALDMILDVEMPMEDRLTEEEHEIVESAAEMLYGMVHARYIVTNRGMHAMYEKYRAAAFGRCPQVYCQGQPVLPVGLSDMPRNYTVNVFCPRCHGLYFPKSTRQANIDGAYFGTTFPHLYLITHPEMIPICPMQQYVPRVYGFRINENSLYFRNHNINNNNNEDEQQQQQQNNNNNSGSGAGALVGGGQNDNTRSGGGIYSRRSGGIRR
jgi:casein kinase II subunit beta